MTRTALMARMLEAVTAEPEREAQHRMAQIKNAADEFRRAFDRSLGSTLTTFPPMSAAEAERARRDAYSCSFHAHYGPMFRERYQAERAAINRAEVA